MQTIRAYFSKSGDARYLSHLDIMRCFTRAVRKSGLNVWYTEGFNPHIYLMFACPLSLGFESECETVDFRLVDDADEAAINAIPALLNSALPQGVEVYKCAEAVGKHTDIAYSRWEILLPCEDSDECAGMLAKFLDGDKIEIEKKTKKGDVRVDDVKPLIKQISWRREVGLLKIEATLSQKNESALNPQALIKSFGKFANIDTEEVRIKRLALLGEKMENFR